ncbi:MAG TPA: hypothetical protein DFS52_15565 [Myxococcales bacterium]|nr:hypothetical protein [Myxococcales bacterium]
MKRIALLCLLLASCAHGPEAERPYQPSSRAQERAELIARLKRDLVKVDRSIQVTDRLIGESRSAPYLPDLIFRQAELYVEKSRYRFHLEAELHAAAGRRGSLVVPDVTLLKQKAVSLYERIVREFPDFAENDQVLFFTAHEHRELGDYDKALQVYQELIDKHPKSNLVAEALLIIADYHFDKSDLDKAETYYQKVLAEPPSPAHDLARYKLGWVWINRGKHGEAVKHFEAVARSPVGAAEGEEALSIKSLALSDLVFSYTESRKAKGAVEYFEALCDSANSFEVVLEKLANRYFIKQEMQNAAPVYRRLLAISRDFERDPERAGRLYETIKSSKGKVVPTAEDVRVLVRVAARTRIDTRMPEDERMGLLEDLEVFSRDLATSLHVEAQKKNDKAAYSEAADAYLAYLELFRGETHKRAMLENLAESLFNAERFAEAGRAYEKVAAMVEGEEREKPLFSALVAFQNALKEPGKLSYFDRTNARFGIRQLGAFYVKSYPQNPNAPKVKLNVARAYYEEGEFRQAGELFTAFASEHPGDADASAAAHLALDSFHSLKDYKALADAGAKLLAVSALPATLQQELRDILASAKAEELSEVVIASDTGEEDAITRLVKIADDPAREGTDLAERALTTALGHAVTRRQIEVAEDVARKIIERFPKSAPAANAALTLARLSAEVGDFDSSAAHYESMAAQFEGDPKAVDALETAGELRLMIGDLSRAVADFEKVAAARKDGESLARLAEARLSSRDLAGAQQTAEAALKADSGSARAAAVLGEALLEQGKAPEAEQALLAAGPALQNAMQTDPESLAKVYFLWGEAVFAQFKAIGPEDIERKANMLQVLQQAYTSAAQLGGDWAIAGMFRLARSLDILAASIEQMPEPPGLKPRDRAELKATLQRQASELRVGSGQAFEACVKRARELEIYTPFALGCATRREIDPKLPVPAPRTAPEASRIKPFREALSRDPDDIKALEGLGQVLLEAGDYHRARLAFARIGELDLNYGPAQAALGFVHLKMGEPVLAVAALNRALEIDARDAKARANLAAIKCRFGDEKGARAELKRLKTRPSGPDVDPEYTACAK